jgi:hypothetical protein
MDANALISGSDAIKQKYYDACRNASPANYFQVEAAASKLMERELAEYHGVG